MSDYRQNFNSNQVQETSIPSTASNSQQIGTTLNQLDITKYQFGHGKCNNQVLTDLMNDQEAEVMVTNE